MPEELDTELAELLGPQKRPCATVALLERLPEASRRVVEAALIDGTSPHRIEQALRQRGLPSVSEDTLRKHTTGQCQCAN